MLTRRQLALLDFITRYVDDHRGVSPTFEEMCVAIDNKSKSWISEMLIGLEERGFIRKIPNRSRAIEVLKRPQGAEPPIDRAKRNLAIALRALEEADGEPFGATLALIAIKTAMEHLGEKV